MISGFRRRGSNTVVSILKGKLLGETHDVSFLRIDPRVDLSNVPGLKIARQEAGVYLGTVGDKGLKMLRELADAGLIALTF